jgi:hypothetical protein
MRRIFPLALLLVTTLPATAQDTQAQRILQSYEAAKPSAKSLAFYSLDWAADWQTAKARARQERRPIFLIGVTNITAGCNFYSGHT